MKKSLKKLFAIALAAAMVMALCVNVMAVDTYQISVDTEKDKSTHTYKVYQIFTGTPDPNNKGRLTDVQYGSSYPGGRTGAVPEEELTAITDARAWAADNYKNLGNPVDTLNAVSNPTYDGAVPGWYLIVDVDYEDAAAADAYSAFMVQVVDADTTFAPKKDVPSVDKQVQDEVDDAEAAADEQGWGETADHAIGETFQFKLTATIPANEDLKAYKTYMVQFNDTMSDGVTFESIDSVTVYGTTVTEYTSSASAGQAGGSWTLKIDDVIPIVGDDFGEKDIVIEVVYNAHLNTAAFVNYAAGDTKNENTVSLTYSNNPDATGAGNTDTTPEDSVWVFTYGSDNTKVDANEEPVAGAGFTLYKGETAIQLYKVGTTYYVYDSTKTDYPEDGTVVTEMKTDAVTGKFDIKGLDVGEYILKETTVPEGYVACNDIDVKIVATHVEQTDGVPYVDLTNSEGLTNSVVNLTGATLPSTGGIGTKIFYGVGAVLVVAAGVILISRKRASN